MSRNAIPPSFAVAEQEEDAREMHPPLLRAASPHHRTASPAAILRSVDRNSSSEPLWTTPTKTTTAATTAMSRHQQQASSSSYNTMKQPLRPCFRRFELLELSEESASPFPKSGGSSTRATTTSRLCGTPNSLDVEMQSPLQGGIGYHDDDDGTRPQCTNPVALTLWHKAAQEVSSPLMMPPAPHLAAAPPTAALLRPTATRGGGAANHRSMGVC